MATVNVSSRRYSFIPPEPPQSDNYYQLCQPPYELHRAVFHGDLETVRQLLLAGEDAVNAQDCHGKDARTHAVCPPL